VVRAGIASRHSTATPRRNSLSIGFETLETVVISGNPWVLFRDFFAIRPRAEAREM
jgi:hypothetical protein